MSENKRSGTEKAQSIRLLVNGSSRGVSEFMEETTGPLVGRGGGGDAGGDVGGDGIVRTLCDLSRSALLLHFKRRVCGDIDEEGGSLMSRSDQALHPAAPLEARVAHATTQREVLNRCVQPPASPTAATICARAHRPPPALLLHHHHHPVFLTSGLYLRCASQAGRRDGGRPRKKGGRQGRGPVRSPLALGSTARAPLCAATGSLQGASRIA